jgi:hypothetical protein
LAQIEQAQVDRLAGEVAAWRLALSVTDYVAALRARLATMDKETASRVSEWCDWAERWARHTDPVTNPATIKGLEPEVEVEADPAPGWR